MITQGQGDCAEVVGIQKVHNHAVAMNFVAILLRIEYVADLELHAEAVMTKTLGSIEIDRPYMMGEVNIAIIARTLIVGCKEHRKWDHAN